MRIVVHCIFVAASWQTCSIVRASGIFGQSINVLCVFAGVFHAQLHKGQIAHSAPQATHMSSVLCPRTVRSGLWQPEQSHSLTWTRLQCQRLMETSNLCKWRWEPSSTYVHHSALIYGWLPAQNTGCIACCKRVTPCTLACGSAWSKAIPLPLLPTG